MTAGSPKELSQFPARYDEAPRRRTAGQEVGRHIAAYRVLSSVRQSSDVKHEGAWRVHVAAEGTACSLGHLPRQSS